MIGFHTHLKWTDEHGNEQRLPGWDSRLHVIGHEDISSCDAQFVGGVCSCEAPHPWRGMIERENVISSDGDGYPTRYELPVESVIALYARAEGYGLRDLTLESAPVDAAARIAELASLPPGTVVTASEWDQS
ncbi:MAG: hypothetical protein ACTIA6_13360 [Pseudoclavibacter sp.]